MEHLNPLKIGKYTFWITFGIANFIFFGFLINALCRYAEIAESFAICGFFYIGIAFWVNLLILLFLLIYSYCYKEKQRESLIGAAILLINIPLAIAYMFLGFSLLDYFNI